MASESSWQFRKQCSSFLQGFALKPLGEPMADLSERVAHLFFTDY
jgi:hypothetical protein